MSREPNVWLITGSSSGFGHRLVSSALARGDRVIATARSLEKLKALHAHKTPEELENLRFLRLDLLDSEEVLKECMDEAVSIWGRIDVLVNNAGGGLPGYLEEGGSSLLRKQFDMNVFGTMNVTTAALPHLRKKRSGTIVIIGSRSAWKTELPGIGPYGASKAAVHAIGETLAVELAPFNIRVLIVEPGAFRTEGIYSNAYYTANPIPDYDELREISIKRFGSVAGTEKGDPDKAMEAVVDVVRGEGVAKGREWPLYLVLGEDADGDVRAKCGKILGKLDEWGHVSKGVSFDQPQT